MGLHSRREREAIMREIRLRRDGDRQAFLREVRLSVAVPDEALGHAAAVPAVRALRDGLALDPRVTFLVGDNGSGKSTVLEGLAVACRMNAEGGGRHLRHSTRASHAPLGEHLTVARGLRIPRDDFFLRAESLFTVATELERIGEEFPEHAEATLAPYGGRSLHEQSHGESFVAVLQHRFGPDGLYLLDEPESALSPKNVLVLARRIVQLVADGSQFVIATHSPLLTLAIPGARVVRCDQGGLTTIAAEEAPAVVLTRRFLADPAAHLRPLLEEERGGPAGEGSAAGGDRPAPRVDRDRDRGDDGAMAGDARTEIEQDVRGETGQDVRAEIEQDVRGETGQDVRGETGQDVRAETEHDVRATIGHDARAEVEHDVRATIGGGFVRELLIDPRGTGRRIRDEVHAPWIEAAVKEGLALHPAVTFLVGENGAGKSTLAEAIALAMKLNPEGGGSGWWFRTRSSHSDLGAKLLVRGRHDPPLNRFFLRAESVFTLATAIDEGQNVGEGGLEAYGGRSLHEQSHGESFLALALHRLGPHGFFVLDEPEAALSPLGELALLRRMHELVLAGGQLVIATHSPLLLAYPHATILRCDDAGIAAVAYDDAGPVAQTRRWLADPAAAVAQAVG